jgi:signal recognition particle receptor subunit beta
MVFFNYALRKLNAKIVYYGPGLCGKTTNLQWIHDHFEGGDRGKMISLATEGDRTIFFDLLPIEIGTIRGMEVTLQLYTVPGQVHYNSTRQLVLKGADGVVFVADSQRAMHQSNLESLTNLGENLQLQGIEIDDFPHVLQFNKRDLGDLLSIEELNNSLNRFSVPIFEAVATEGIGVQETLEGIVKLVMRSLRERYEPAGMAGRVRPKPSRPARPQPAAPSAPRPPAAPQPPPATPQRPPSAAPAPPQPAPTLPAAQVAPPPAAAVPPSAPEVLQSDVDTADMLEARPATAPPPAAPQQSPPKRVHYDVTAVHELGGPTADDQILAQTDEIDFNVVESAPHEDTFSDEETFGGDEPQAGSSVREVAQGMVAEYLGSESVEPEAPDFGEMDLGAESLAESQEIELLDEDSEEVGALGELSLSEEPRFSDSGIEELELELDDSAFEPVTGLTDTAKEREIDRIRAPSPFVQPPEPAPPPSRPTPKPDSGDPGPAFARQPAAKKPVTPAPQAPVAPQPPTKPDAPVTPEPAVSEPAAATPEPAKPPQTSPVGLEELGLAEKIAQTKAEASAKISDDPFVIDDNEPFGAPKPTASAVVKPVVRVPRTDPSATIHASDENALRVALQGEGAIAEYGQVRELDLVVPVPGQWVGNRRVTLQLRLTLEPTSEDIDDGSGGAS